MIVFRSVKYEVKHKIIIFWPYLLEIHNIECGFADIFRRAENWENHEKERKKGFCEVKEPWKNRYAMFGVMQKRKLWAVAWE